MPISILPDRTPELEKALHGNYRLRASRETLERARNRFGSVYEMDGRYYALDIGHDPLHELQKMGIETRRVYPSDATDVRSINQLVKGA